MDTRPWGFHTHRVETPLDAAGDWLDGASRWPLRILIAAVLCPVIISFAGQTQFLFYWDLFTEAGPVGSIPLVALTPLIAIGLLIASRFPPSLQARAISCALCGVLPLAIVSFQTHWVVAALSVGLILVAAGNRVAKQFTLHHAPRIAAAVGGGILLTLGCIPVGGTSALGALLSGQTWSNGGWMLGVGLVGVLAFALAGVGLVIPRLPRGHLSIVISVAGRLTLAWAPACLIYGRLSLGGRSVGISAAADIAGATMAFKVFGIVYPILIAGATGVASWAVAALWGSLDSEPIPDPAPDDLDELVEAIATPVGAAESADP